MKNKKLTVFLTMGFLSLSIFGCSSIQPASSTEDVAEIIEDGENLDEILDKDDEVVADTINDLPDDVVETIIEDGVVPTSSGLDFDNLEEDIVESEPAPSPHVHQYVESITVQPTCAVAGERTFTCECGDVKIESVPATGSHNWVEQTTVIHHDELGHVEQTQVLTGYTEPHTEYECSYCGHRENSPAALTDHRYNSANGNFDHAFARTFAYDYPAEPIYETQSKWVVDQEAWDEVVVTGYICSVCGLTNSTNTVEQTNTVE